MANAHAENFEVHTEKTTRIPKTPNLEKSLAKPTTFFSDAQENTNPNVKIPSYMQPTKASAVQKSSVLSRPIEKGVTKPVTARHSMLPTRTTPSTSTVRASTASSRLSLVPTTTTKVPTTNSRLSMAPTSATRSTTSTTTTTTRSTVPSARSAIPSTRATKAAAPTSIPAKTRYTSSKPITSTSLAEDTQAKQAAQKSLSEQQMNLKLEAMQGMMATLVSQMSVMQSQYQNPPDSPDKEPFPVLDLPPPIQPQVQPVIIKVPVHTNKRAQAPTHRSPPREIRIITKKIRKEVKKPKPPKPQIDTTVYTNQIADLTQKLEDLKKLKTEIEFNHQIQTETLNSKLQLLNTQLEYARNTNNVEREKNNQLKCEISTRTAENSQLETQFLIIKRQMTDEISNTKATLGEELRQKTEAFTNESNALQTEIEFFENQCEERSQEKVMLENCIAHEIKTTEITEKRIRTSETLRKKLHNEIQELKGNIRVICRVRPFLGREKPGSVKYSYPKGNQELLVERKAINDVTSKKPSGAKQDSFKFDRVFGPQASQAEVFEEISHLVQSALDGYNCCIFAYGQTGSGKTYTMEGPADSIEDEKSRGMISRTVAQIFQTCEKLKWQGWEYELSASFLEIYNDTLNDLLNPKKTNLNITQTNKKTTAVSDLTSVAVKSSDAVFSLLKKASDNRRTCSTDMNDRSSRSHSIFQLSLQGKNSITNESVEGILNLIDLAGSEKLDQSGATGLAQKEAIFINTSLQCLGKVIQALANNDDHIPYRDCKLTRVLSNSLGGNSKTLMFVNVSPAEDHVKESVNSLHFATKANSCEVGQAKKQRTIGKF